MKSLLTLLILIATSMQNVKTIFDFTQENDGEGWYIVNDGVMGGLSKGQFLSEDGVSIFKGTVSRFAIKVKGDGKAFQFRVKSDRYQQFSYVFEFTTSGEWEEISIPFASLSPRFRGRNLDMPNFDGKKIEEVAFLIGNKREESFKLQLSAILAQ